MTWGKVLDFQPHYASLTIYVLMLCCWFVSLKSSCMGPDFDWSHSCGHVGLNSLPVMFSPWYLSTQNCLPPFDTAVANKKCPRKGTDLENGTEGKRRKFFFPPFWIPSHTPAFFKIKKAHWVIQSQLLKVTCSLALCTVCLLWYISSEHQISYVRFSHFTCSTGMTLWCAFV